MALAFFLPLPWGDTMGGAVGMTAASTRTRVCGPFRTSCATRSLFTVHKIQLSPKQLLQC